jgi:hypothetical protein
MAALAGLGASAIPGDAHACGGLFCNGPPPNPFAPLPVAQNGENVVFAITPDPKGGAPTLEAHIQIAYTGDAAKFSWVVPVDAAPTLSTGTDRLFTSLASVTSPQFSPNFETIGTCKTPNYGSTGSAGTTGAAGTSGAAGAGGPINGGSVQVSFQGAVGPFDAAVIKSDDPMALKMWLSDNAYVVTDAAGALIDTYVRENKYFVALKLLNGVGVRQIQPIVLTFRGTEACVPLRLTAIAANPDMPVLVWVLGSKRVAPRDYFELSIDEAKIDWASGGSNYFGPSGLVSQAANEAGGNAFITEYAGVSGVARQTVFVNGQIDLTALGNAMIPPQYVQLLVQMGLANDPLMLPLLAKYIPMPDAAKAMNITEAQFYGNIQSYWNTFAFPKYDLAGLTMAISDSIVTPRMKAQMTIDAHQHVHLTGRDDEGSVLLRGEGPARRVERAQGDDPDHLRQRGLLLLRRASAGDAARRPHLLAPARVEGRELPVRGVPGRDRSQVAPGGARRVGPRARGGRHGHHRQLEDDQRHARRPQQEVRRRGGDVAPAAGDPGNGRDGRLLRGLGRRLRGHLRRLRRHLGLDGRGRELGGDRPARQPRKRRLRLPAGPWRRERALARRAGGSGARRALAAAAFSEVMLGRDRGP